MGKYRPYSFESFGKGLNLRDKPDAVEQAQCIDALNVLFTQGGAVEQRPGYESFLKAALTNRVDSLSPFYKADGTKQLIAGCGTRLEALSAAGAVVASATGLTAGRTWDFVRYGDPNAEAIYAGNGADTLRKWNGSEWSAPTATLVTGPPGEEKEEVGKAMPKANYLAAWSEEENRLVMGGFTGAKDGPGGWASSPSHLWFSSPGDPTKYNELDYVQLGPGDGEKIMGVVAWRELIFVFKETRFWTFSGVSTDAEGGSVFNFLVNESGAGLVAPRALCVHPTGVYFMGRHGVYRATGSRSPELISPLLTPLWQGGASDFYKGGTISQGSIENCAMETDGDLIYLSFPTSEANDRTLVFDPEAGWWAPTDLPAAALTTFYGDSRQLVFGLSSGANQIARYDRALTNDDGAAIVARFHAPWGDLGSPDVKKIRATKLWAAGGADFFFSVAPDFNLDSGTVTHHRFTNPDSGEWDVSEWGGANWAGSRGVRMDERRVAVRGSVFSIYAENEQLDKKLSLHRVEHLLSNVRDPAKESK